MGRPYSAESGRSVARKSGNRVPRGMFKVPCMSVAPLAESLEGFAIGRSVAAFLYVDFEFFRLLCVISV